MGRWLIVHHPWDASLVHPLNVTEPLKTSLPDGTCELRLSSKWSYIFVGDMMRPDYLQDLPLTSHIECIDSGLISFSKCPALCSIEESWQNTGIIKLQLGSEIDVSISPYTVQLLKGASSFPYPMVKFFGDWPISTIVGTKIFEVLDYFNVTFISQWYRWTMWAEK